MGVGPESLPPGWKLVALLSCCSVSVSVSEKLSGMVNWILSLVIFGGKMRVAGNSGTDACLY